MTQLSKSLAKCLAKSASLGPKTKQTLEGAILTEDGLFYLITEDGINYLQYETIEEE